MLVTAAAFEIHQGARQEAAPAVRRGLTGHRVGESHPNAVLTDREVDRMREMADARNERGRRVWSQRQLAEIFEVSIWTVRAIEQGRRR